MNFRKKLFVSTICMVLLGNVIPVCAEENTGNNTAVYVGAPENEGGFTNPEEDLDVQDSTGTEEVVKTKDSMQEDNEGQDEYSVEDRSKEGETEKADSDNVRVTGESWLWPLQGHTDINSGYGYRIHPISGKRSFHYGIDIPAPAGTPIRASQSGYLVVRGKHSARGYWSVIDHQNGTYSEYQHMSSYAISANQWVNQGDILGYVGMTGSATGNHLHFEISTGAVNQAGSYDSMTTVNTNKDSINYVYSISQNKPENPWISMDKYLIQVGENVTFSVGASGATGFVLGIDREGIRVSTPNLISATTYTMQFQQAGDYTVYVTTTNEYGGTDSDRIAFRVYDKKPSNAKVIIDKPVYKIGETVTFKVSSQDGFFYVLGIDKDGKRISTPILGDKTTYQTSFNSSGNYTVYVTCTNNYGGTDSSKISFTVGSVQKKPEAVTGLKAASAGKNKVKLMWNNSKSAEGYLIYAQKNGKYGYCGMTTKTTYMDNKSLDASYNFYWVFPYVKDSTGKMITGNCTRYVYAKGVTLAVKNLKAASQTGGVKLMWSKSDGADGYLIYGKTASGKYTYISMTTKGTTYIHKAASKKEYNFYWVFPYHKDKNGKMLVGGTSKYVYGKAK